MELSGKWFGNALLKSDPLISGFRKEDSPHESTNFVEKWLDTTEDEMLMEYIDEDFHEEDIPKDQNTTFKPVKRIKKPAKLKGQHYVCYHCHHVAESFKILKTHIEANHIRKKPYQKRKLYEGDGCPHCDYVPTYLPNLTRHLKEVHGDGDTQTEFKCNKCSSSYKRQSDLNSHIMSKHEQKSIFKCTLCTYGTRRKYLLKRHLYYKHSIGKPLEKNKKSKPLRYKCNFCLYRSHDPSFIKTHVMYRHTKEKPFQCRLCEHKTTTKGDLKAHVKSVHTRERPYHCEHCDYRATKSDHLKTHILRKHTTEKKYQCSFCDYSAVSSWSIKSHLSFKHKEETKGTYKCIFCSLESRNNKDLKEHIMTDHSDVNPLPCPHCDYCAKSEVSLKKHVTAKHKQPEEQIT